MAFGQKMDSSFGRLSSRAWNSGPLTTSTRRLSIKPLQQENHSLFSFWPHLLLSLVALSGPTGSKARRSPRGKRCRKGLFHNDLWAVFRTALGSSPTAVGNSVECVLYNAH